MSQLTTEELIRLFQDPNNPPVPNTQQAFIDLYGNPNVLTAQPDTAYGLASLYAPPVEQVAPVPTLPPSAGFWGNVGDAALVIPKSATRLVSSVGGLIDPQGAVRQWGDEATDWLASFESEENRANREENARRIALAKAKGESGWGASWENFVDNPLTTIGDIAESVLPSVAVGVGAAALAPETAGMSLVAAAPMILGGIQGAGETRKDINDHIMAMSQAELNKSPVYLQYIAEGLTPEQARIATATSWTEHGGEVLANGLSSAALERLGGFMKLGKTGGVLNSAGGRFARELGTETADETFQQLTTNKAIHDVDNSHRLTSDLGSAAFGGLLGGGLGGGVAYAQERLAHNFGGEQTGSEQVQMQSDQVVNDIVHQTPTDTTNTAETQPKNTAVNVNNTALDNVLSQIANKDERQAIKQNLIYDIQDGVIEQIATEDNEYGKLAQAYLAEVGQQIAQPTAEQAQNPSVEQQNEQMNSFSEQNNVFSEQMNDTQDVRESRSAMKSVEANIARGKERMTQAILNKADVKRGMYNNEFGWIDFVWGDDGTTKPLDKNGEPKGRGIAHIFEARERKNGMSEAETSAMLVDEIVETIAKGTPVNPNPQNKLQLDYRSPRTGKVYRATLVKNKGNNGWVLTAFDNSNKYLSEGANKLGNDSLEPTINSPTLSRADKGASLVASDSGQFANERGLNEQGSDTAFDWRPTNNSQLNDTHRHLREGGAVGADNDVNVTNSQPTVNTQATKDQQTLSQILGNDTASHIEVVDRNTVQPPKGETAESLLAGNVEGWYDPTTQKIYIYSDNITANNVMNRDERLAWVAWHELAHRGVNVKLGNRFNDIVTRMGKHPVVERIANTIQKERAEYGDIPFTVAVEEAVAEINAAVETGNWSELESRYNVRIGQSWKNSLGQYLRPFANVLQKVVNAIIGRNPNSTAMTTQELFDVLAEIRQGGTESDTQAESSNGEVRYSLSEDPNSDFAKAVDAFVNGDEVKTSISLGTTPDVLKMIGLPDVEVKIKRKVLSKVMRGKHAIEPEVLKQLPQQINDPVAVLQSSAHSSNPNGFVVLTELTEFNSDKNRDEPVIAALHLTNSGDVQLIEVASAYGKELEKLQEMIDNDPIHYWNKTKGSHLANVHWLQLPLKLRSNANLSANDIKTETDLSQYQSENKSDNGTRFSRKAPQKENYQRDLMVTHSLSAENIMHADKMGGLPMASLAISKQGSNVDFGEVTLIGDRNHIDPKGDNKAKVFGSDIYSPRYPQVSYKLNAKDQRALYQRFEDTAKLLNDKGFDWNFTGNLEQKGVSNILSDSAEVQYEFLQSKGIEPNIVYEEKAHNEFADYLSVQKALAEGGIDALRSDDFLLDFAKERLAKLEETRSKQGNTTSPIARKSNERKIGEMQDIINMSAENRAFYLNGDIKRLVKGLDPTTDVDYGRTKAALNEQITQHHYQNAFNQYVQDIVAPLDISEQLENGENPRTGETRYVEHSLENVVKKLKQNLRGGESFDYGTGSLRAKVTPQFKSVPDIQKNKSRLVDKETSEQAIEQMENDVATLGEQLGVGNEIYNLLHNAVDESIEQAFVYSSVENTPQNRQAVADMLAKLKAMPTEYFEAKAKDVTQFSDFLGAVVPENLPKNAYNVLEKAGLKIYEYNPDDTNSRAETVKQATNELDEKSGGNVLFSRRPKAESLEKLRNSKPIKISGKEIEPSKDIKQYQRNALEYGKSLRGVYTNKDTRGRINLTRSSILEVLHHDFKNLEHLQSVAAIPQIIENATYIDTLPNDEDNKNFDIDEYDYYVAGLNIGGKDYTVKAVVGNGRDGEKYYDHKLSPIEKDELLSLALRITSSERTKENSSLSEVDDKRLLQILQVDNQQKSDKSDNGTRFSRAQTVENLAKTGKAQADPTAFDDLKAKDYDGFKKRFNQAVGKVDEWVADGLRPVNDWIDGLQKEGLSEFETEQLKGKMYRSKGVRDAHNSDIEQKFLKPLLQKVSKIAKKHKLDELSAKRLVGYWASTRYAIEKNKEILERERKEMIVAKGEMELARREALKGDQEATDAYEQAKKAYAKAERQYRYRKHDVESTDSNEEFRVGTAGGWSNPEAETIMRNIERHIPKAELEDAARHLYQLNRYRLNLDHEAGRYTEEQYKEFKKNVHYVPLTGDPNAEEDFDGISGAGQNALNTTKDRALKGRKTSEAEDGIDASWRAINKSTTYAGWADFKEQIDDIYQHKVDELVEQGHSEKSAREQVAKTLGITKSKMGGTTRSNDDVLIRKVGGVYYEYGLPKKVMTALKNDNVEYANGFLKALSKPTSWYARGVTQWTVTFAPMNMLRDTWEKSEFIRVQKLFDKDGKQLSSKTMDKIGRAVVKNALLNKDVWNATKRFGFNQDLRTDNQHDVESMLKDLLANGGVSTYSTYLAKTETDLVKQLQAQNKPIASKLKKAGEILESYNKVFDTVSALSAYKAMIDNGVDKAQAASITLELTNFRKTGAGMRGIKALYMFAQPTAMGARNLIKYLSTKKGQRRFLGYMVVMTALYSALRAMDDDNEGGNIMDQLGDITRYIPLPLGMDKYFKIPVGFGMPQMAWNFATNIVKAANKDISVSEALVNMSTQVFKTIAPISPSEISAANYPTQKLALTFTPSILQPIVQNALNRSAFGNTITPSFVSGDKLKAEQAKSTTAQFWKDLAIGISDTLGIDMHPEQVKNLVDGYSGIFGSLKELSTIFIENPNRELLGRRTRTPFLNQFIGTTNEFAIQSRYYEASEQAQSMANEYKSRKERGKLDGWLTPEKEQIVRFHEMNARRMGQLRAVKSKMTKALHKGQMTEEAYQARLKTYNTQMDNVQRAFLKRWRKMQGLSTVE
ncbi:LPD38 domain-containing protein [Lonepinella sp. BR2474]|uniref:LPD3 domain-containing protein n=1 Tax=Lonepinella sp. BR2474 TaxID=3434548 RepID=UPI003F6E426B